MKTEFKVLGLDVSKSSVTCHLLDSYPKGGLKNYWDKTRNKASTLYPVFYSNPDKKKKQKSAYDFADYLKETNPSIAIIEPTGNHYSRLWASIIKSLGINILWVGHVELRRYRGGKNLPNKSDSADALAMAAYAHDEDHKTEDGELNLKYFLMHRPESIDRIRELCQQLEHLNRVQSPIINHARQLLAWQFPEVAHSKSESSAPGRVPPLWGWLANRLEITPTGVTRMNNRYKNSIAKTYQIEIDQFLRLHANWLCDIALEEQSIEAELVQLLKLDEFKPYNDVFDKFGFGIRVRARILSRIYPFEAFLGADGKEVVEYEVREVKKTERERRDDQTVVKHSAGDEKRIKRNRSRDTFKMRVG
ncbi:MAG TPA: transposase, partial [Nostocaceae cyanobacterium]|nr:transposase [Nostocaceae cyanobacterium]